MCGIASPHCIAMHTAATLTAECRGVSGKLLLDKMRVDDLVVAAYTRWALFQAPVMRAFRTCDMHAFHP